MATQPERKALLFFGVVIALGTSVRAARLGVSRSPREHPYQPALEVQIGAADSARRAKFGKAGKAGGPRSRRAPPPPAARVDLDIATESEIEALRGVGPSLARRIIAERDSFGPFGSLEGLKRVRGVGPALVAKLDSTVTFSLLPRPMNTVIPSRSGRSIEPSRHRSRRRVRNALR